MKEGVKKHGSGAHVLHSADVVLALNRRARSVHYALFRRHGHDDEPLQRGHMRGGDDLASMRHLTAQLRDKGLPAPTAVGHRLLYGGFDEQRAEAIVDDDTFALLASQVSRAPGQFGLELGLLQAARMAMPDVPHVASFDTAFHRTIPEVAFTYALPKELRGLGVRRLGFEGLAYEYVVDVLGKDTLGRALIFSLDDTASIAAVKRGTCVDTTMGLTPLGGLVMGTHPGDLDPGVILYLLRSGYDTRALERMFSERAGMLGMSGESDLSALVPRRGRDPEAALGFDVFVSSARKWAGALTTVLGGLDTIVFVGHGSEHPVVRDEICAGLAHLGVVLDPSRNRGKIALEGHGTVISADASRVVVAVLAVDAERMIARHTRTALALRVVKRRKLA